MNPQTTLDAVRELSERATIRPPPKCLPLAKPEDLRPPLKRANATYEELHPPKIGGDLGTAGNNKARKPRASDHCPGCGKRPEYCYCDVKPDEKDFMRATVEKAEAATERRPVVLPAGE